MHQQVLVLLLRYFAGVTLVSLWCYFCAQLSGAVWLACAGAWCSGAEEVTKSHAGALLFIALLACSLHVSTAASTLLDCTLACKGFPQQYILACTDSLKLSSFPTVPPIAYSVLSFFSLFQVTSFNGSIKACGFNPHSFHTVQMLMCKSS